MSMFTVTMFEFKIHLFIIRCSGCIQRKTAKKIIVSNLLGIYPISNQYFQVIKI